MARHSFQDSQKCHVLPICLGREELVTLGQWDQGKVFGILYLRLRVILASKTRLDHLEKNLPKGA